MQGNLKKLISYLIIFALLLSQFSPLFIPKVYAVTSPWTQTDWSGGSGQTSWSDNTKFDSSSSVTTSTAGQVTLQATSSWYNTSWLYRRKITFDNSAQSENLTNFPVLVKLNSTRINYSNTQDSGQDIRFTDSDGTTLLSYEIEKWDETGNSFVWVKVPQIDASSSTDYIYMYYGNSSATDAQSATSVWDSNYKLVQHLKETSGTTTTDSTSNSNTGTKVSATEPNPTTSGQIDGAQTFDGSDDNISMGASASTQITTFTVEAWVKPNNDNGYRRILSRETHFLFGTTSNQLMLGLGNGVGGWNSLTTFGAAAALTNGTIYYVVATYNGTATGYINGSSTGNTVTGSMTSNTNTLFIGSYATGVTGQNWNGDIDEVRMSNSVRSASWIAASYKSGADSFNTFASEESVYSTTPGTLTSSIFDTGNTNSWGPWGNLTYTATTPSNTSVSIKVRTSNSSSMSGATAFSSCTAISSGTDISSNSCVTDGQRYIQYQVSLSNTDSVSTPTLQDLSIGFTLDNTAPNSFDLDSPENNSYTNSERPSFKWKATTDVGDSGLSKYVLEIDNPSIGSGQPAGDFAIDNISPTSTTDVNNNKYTIHYEGFADGDSTNNYILITTKSSSDWGTAENDGKLREGKIGWKVRVIDNAGNETSSSRVVYVDKTGPKVEVSQINDVAYGSSLVTNDTTPTLYGKVTDPVEGSATSDNTTYKAASGPKEVVIKFEKQNPSLTYDLYSLVTISFTESFWESNSQKITDNTLNTAGKYTPFSYTPSEALPQGVYKVTLEGRDKAGNIGSTSFLLKVGSLSQILSPEEKQMMEEEIQKLTPKEQQKIKETLEVTKPETTTPSFWQELISKILSFITTNLSTAYWAVVDTVRLAMGFLYQSATQLAMTLKGIGSQTIVMLNSFQHLSFGILKQVQDDGIIVISKVASLYDSYYQWNQMVAVSISSVIANAAWQSTNKIASSVNLLAMTIGREYNQLANTAPGVAGVTLKAGGRLLHQSVNWFGVAGKGVGEGVAHNVQDTISNAKDGLSNVVFQVGEKTQDVSDTVGLAIIKFTYNFVKEPTRISDVEAIILSPTSVKITWETNHPANGKVNWGYEEGVYKFEQQTDKRTTHHEFVLTGLTANTHYHYEVISHNKNMVYDANRKFKTPAQ